MNRGSSPVPTKGRPGGTPAHPYLVSSDAPQCRETCLRNGRFVMTVTEPRPVSGMSLSVDPLWVLWHAMGEPVPTGAPMNKTGTCDRCGAYSEAASRVKVVVSDKFTGWADYTQHADPLWCVACTWAHTTSEVRTRGWRIGGTRTVEANGPTLFTELDNPLSSHVAITVPLSRHKHILPSARWGVVTTDDRTLVWTATEVMRLRSVAWLRLHGFSEAALFETVPRFEQIARMSDAAVNLTMRHWGELAAWRTDPTYLKVACVATRTPAARESMTGNAEASP